MNDGRAHICSAGLDCSAGEAMAFLGAPENLARWAAGMGAARVHGDGTIEGAFPQTMQPIWARIDADIERATIHFHVGPDPGSLVPRIMIRVVPGEVVETGARTCVVSMVAWRQASMDDARWSGLMSGHEAEILEIKRLIEARAAAPQSPQSA